MNTSVYCRSHAIRNKPTIPSCCLHAKGEVKPIHLKGGLLMNQAVGICGAVQHTWIQRSNAISNGKSKEKM